VKKQMKKKSGSSNELGGGRKPSGKSKASKVAKLIELFNEKKTNEKRAQKTGKGMKTALVSTSAPTKKKTSTKKKRS
jgi:hypothetical protein